MMSGLKDWLKGGDEGPLGSQFSSHERGGVDEKF